MVRAARPSSRSLPAYRFTPSVLMSAAILNPAWSAIHRMNRVVLVMCLSIRFAARSLLSWSAKWASIDRCDSLLIASSVGVEALLHVRQTSVLTIENDDFHTCPNRAGVE